uniref:Ribokinase n=1 Tax=Dictyoglomus thermophilum TaxID=14 RepID=A0A7C3MKW1_DICTH
MEKRITVIGSYNTDLVSKAPHLPKPGETILGGPFIMGPGGKGSNQAVCSARLGAEVYFIGCIGNDNFGKIAKDFLLKENVKVDYLKVTDKTHTGIALIIVDDKTGENMIVVAPGANMEVNIEQINAVKDIILSSDVVLLQLEIPIETISYVLNLVSNERKPLSILNPAPARKLDDKILGKADIVTPNRNELEIITGIKIETLEDVEKASIKMLSYGTKGVVVTLGKDGAFVVTENKRKHIPSFKVEAVDTTGAGDAFNGGLAVALSEGKDLISAVTFASAVAALSVTKMGAASSMPYREEVERFLKEYSN